MISITYKELNLIKESTRKQVEDLKCPDALSIEVLSHKVLNDQIKRHSNFVTKKPTTSKEEYLVKLKDGSLVGAQSLFDDIKNSSKVYTEMYQRLMSKYAIK